MATACTEITCADDCNDAIPAVEFDVCNPEVNFGEIDAIFITNVGNPLTDETDAAEWATRFAAVGATKITELHVVGEKPAPEGTEVVISRNISVKGAKTHTIPFEIHQTNQANYDFMRSFECSRKVLMWYRTAGGLLYGGASGIEATITMDEVTPKNRKDLIMIVGNAKWDAKFHPCRTTSPI